MIKQHRLVTSAASSIVQIVVSGTTLVVLYRYLLETIGVEQLGVWSLVLAMSSMIQVANFGLTGSIVKQIADHDAKGDKRITAIAIETAVITVAFLSLALVACAYPAAKYYLAFAIGGQPYEDALAILPLGLMAFWVLMVTSIYQSGLYGCQLINTRNGLLIAESISHLALCIFLAPRYGLLGLAYARIAQNLITLLASIAYLKGHLSHLSFFPYRWDKTLFREMAGYATSFQVISLLTMLSDPITKALLSRLGSVSMVGYYEMAAKLVHLFRSLIVNTNQVLVPTFANLRQLQPHKVAELYLKSSRLVTYLALPGFGLLITCAPLVSELWVGRYEPVFVWSIVILSSGWLANTLAVPAYFASLGTGEMRINVLSHIAMTILNILLALSLGYYWGGLGVVAGWAIALTIGGLLLNILYCNQNSIALGSLISGDDRILLYYFIAGLAITYLGWQILPRYWEVWLSALDAPVKWGPAITSGVTISAYLAIMTTPMWKHSTRNDIQRWLIGIFSGNKASQVHTD
jgi:O-antigen/teichoic acid export membrane protein